MGHRYHRRFALLWVGFDIIFAFAWAPRSVVVQAQAQTDNNNNNLLVVEDTVEKKSEDDLLLCLDSMFHSDRDRDDALTLGEYKSFVKYYSSRAFGNDDSSALLSEDLKDLFEVLVHYSSAHDRTGLESINIKGSDPSETPFVKKTRLEELRTMCRWIHGCTCCGVCFQI